MSAPDLLVVHEEDNVATALRDCDRGAARVSGVGGEASTLLLLQPVRLGHKAALSAIAVDMMVVKHGQPIGRATTAIAPGEHVHVHNVESLSVDDREMGNGK